MTKHHQDSHAITEKDRALFDSKKFDAMLDKITEFLIKKTYHYNKAQNKNNMSFLGDIGFWFEVDEKNMARLHFTKHPSMWDYEKINYDIEMEDRQMMVSKGFIV
jgi:hypothetical protein